MLSLYKAKFSLFCNFWLMCQLVQIANVLKYAVAFHNGFFNFIFVGLVFSITHNSLRYETLGNSKRLHYQGTANFDARTEAQITTPHPMFYDRVLVAVLYYLQSLISSSVKTKGFLKYGCFATIIISSSSSSSIIYKSGYSYLPSINSPNCFSVIALN